MAARRFFVGLDLGQSHDFTAISVIERVERKLPWDPVRLGWEWRPYLNLRFLQRIPLGTPYPDVVARVGQITRNSALREACELLVDATGVGRPVVDLLRRAGLDCTVTPVVVTGGIAEAYANGYYNVPKRNLITGLQVALQSKNLTIAAELPHRAEFINELAEMRVKVSIAGNEQFGAWREGTHDDLVFAAALACWGARRAYPGDVPRVQS